VRDVHPGILTQATAPAQDPSARGPFLRRFPENLMPSCLSFRASSALRQRHHGSTMHRFSRLEGERKSGAIRYEISPRSFNPFNPGTRSKERQKEQIPAGEPRPVPCKAPCSILRRSNRQA
jgi:hypothetical protein